MPRFLTLIRFDEQNIPAPSGTSLMRRGLGALHRAGRGPYSLPAAIVNRAVAVAKSRGPADGLEIVDALADEPALKDYHLLPSVRGDLLERLGRTDGARAELERAASPARNARERELLANRAARTGSGDASAMSPAASGGRTAEPVTKEDF